jgi:uncharacterized protein DUF6448
MKEQPAMKWARRGRLWALALILALASGAIATAWSPVAEAHCDSISGPVVNAARQALAAGDVNVVLPYVKPEAEAELASAFQRTQAARQAGGEAQQVAERWFFETTVRLHRAGEGAAFTGLKEVADLDPALAAADEALETGDLHEVTAVLTNAVQSQLSRRYHEVEEARQHAAREGTVAAHRERVEAELAFETYVYQLHQAAQGAAAAHEADLPSPGLQLRTEQTGATCP